MYASLLAVFIAATLPNGTILSDPKRYDFTAPVWHCHKNGITFTYLSYFPGYDRSFGKSTKDFDSSHLLFGSCWEIALASSHAFCAPTVKIHLGECVETLSRHVSHFLIGTLVSQPTRSYVTLKMTMTLAKRDPEAEPRSVRCLQCLGRRFVYNRGLYKTLPTLPTHFNCHLSLSPRFTTSLNCILLIVL